MGGKNSTAAYKLTSALLVIYLMALLWILLFKLGVRFSYMEKRSVNLIPFDSLTGPTGKGMVGEIVLNTIIFVPLGIYTGILSRKWSFAGKCLFFFGLSLFIEALQFILRIGAFDITDIITNLSGGIIGLMLFSLVEKLAGNPARSQNLINIIGTTGTILVILLLLLLKLNLLPIKYQ